MIKLLASMLLAAVLTVSAQAKEASAKGKPPLHANLAKDLKGPATTSFSSADALVYLIYHGDTLKKGDKIRVAWYTESGSKAVKKGESVNAADRDNANGYLNIGKPASGWAVGKWRADLFVNDMAVESYKFTISK